MSDESLSSSENPPISATESAPRARRVSTPRPKKTAKEAVGSDTAPAEPVPALATEVSSIPFPSTSRRDERPENHSQVGDDWPEPEAESGGSIPSQSETSKRKRRRRKGKGQGNTSQNPSGDFSNEEQPQAVLSEPKPLETSSQEPRPRPPSGPPHQPQQRPKIDPELLTKMAWKIYLAEVSEEGVALIGDSDAKDLSRRCFRLAEIFIEEQARRR